ncbi:MAG: NAD(+) synthase [Candidatus Vogelbacteria bacterium]|nr:NAD(+) synthase [Candidatus Vogelbacteria bacterium]
MIKDFKKLETALTERARELGRDRKKVFLAVSGGVDSSLVAAVLCRAFGSENVVGLYRDIKNNPKHKNDVALLQSVLGFKLIMIDGNSLYDDFLAQTKKEFTAAGLPWAEEGSAEADASGFTSAYASCKSRFTTPMAGFISKAIDNGKGLIFGTGNAEEDGLLRYFDKFGDGAVDNNIINGLTKSEVRQMATYFGVPQQIVTKLPSADLEGNGDAHNDESQLTSWAKKMGYNLELSYGSADGSAEGNIAWALKENEKNGVVNGKNGNVGEQGLANEPFHYTEKQIPLILFLREIERSTKHKTFAIPGLERSILHDQGLVD